MAVVGLAVVIFRRLNQPAILGYLIAGVLVGPFTLLQTPVTNTESIWLLADLGLVLLLFAIGLEFWWRRIRQVGLSWTAGLSNRLNLGYKLARERPPRPLVADLHSHVRTMSLRYRRSPGQDR